MTNKPVVFPQYLDNAQQILMFEADDLMPILRAQGLATDQSPPQGPAADVTVERIVVPGRNGAPDVPCIEKDEYMAHLSRWQSMCKEAFEKK